MTSRRQAGASGLRRQQRGGARPPTLTKRILAKAADAGLACPALFLASVADSFTLVSGKVSAWANLGSVGGSATQGTDANRPTYSATAINGKPGITLDGGDYLATGNVDTGATAHAVVVLFSNAGSTVTFAASYGYPNAAAPGVTLRTTRSGSTISGQGRDSSVFSVGQSAASYPMTDPAVVTATHDYALTASEARIRHAGVDVTNNWSLGDGNCTGPVGARPVTIGSLEAGALPLNGAIAAVCLLAHSGAWSGAPLTAVADIETLIATEWGL